MKKMIKKILLQKLKELENCDLQGLDRNSFENGYSNGFVKGFFISQNYIIGITIILIISMIFNFILFI